MHDIFVYMSHVVGYQVSETHAKQYANEDTYLSHVTNTRRLQSVMRSCRKTKRMSRNYDKEVVNRKIKSI